MIRSRWFAVGAALVALAVSADSFLRGSARSGTDQKTASVHTPRDSRLPYLPGIDGLRAIGVIAVLLYHAEVSWMPGGFLGVELFFVVSGYLITSLILAERSSHGTVDLPRFWLRRARRLLPAAFSVIGAALVYTIIFLPDEVATLRGDALAALGYASNWYLIFDDQSYFEFIGRPSLLRHLWSLAVEEQFYLVWPLLTLIFLRLGRPPAAVLIVAMAAASAALMGVLYEPGEDPSRVYYGTDTRLTGLLVGSALAFVLVPSRAALGTERGFRFAGNLLGTVCLAAVLYFFAAVGEFDSSLYRGGFAVMAVVAALLIAAVVQPGSILGTVLGRHPFRWIGLRSYSIYLWHWPIFMLTRPHTDIALDGIELLALRLAIVAVLSELSYRLIETPFRRGSVGTALKKWFSLPNARTLPRLALRWSAPVVALAAITLTVALSTLRADSIESPQYLTVTDVQTISWSAFPAAQTPSSPIKARSVPIAEIAHASTSPPPPSLSSPPAPPPSSTSTEDPATNPPPSPSPSTTPAQASAEPKPSPAGVFPGRVLAIGDSVMLGAATHLQATFRQVEVDAEVGRQASTTIALLRQRRDSGLLGDAVVVHIGNNGVFTADHFDRIMEILTDVPNVVFLNTKVPRQWEGPNNAVLADRVSAHPNAVLIDWHAVGSDNEGYFWSDNIHLRPEGAAAYSALIARSLPTA